MSFLVCYGLHVVCQQGSYVGILVPSAAVLEDDQPLVNEGVMDSI